MTQNKTTTNTNFHSSGLRQKVDQLMDILYAGGVNNPMDSIEQISYLLFLRLLSERDEQLAVLSKKYKRLFSGKVARYAWGNFVTLTGDELFDSIRSTIENLHELPDLSDTGRLLFRRATLKIYDRPTLRAVIQSIHEMDLAEHGGADIKGDMYEYLLSKISMSGTNGQFRTPRHIIDFIVEMVDPKPGRRICDPACGTAGFLISAFNYILKQNTSKADLKAGNVTGDKLKPAQWKFLEQQAFTGFDNDANMIKIAILNLYLHKLEKANIDLHNPLTTTEGGTYPGPQYDCILANPPFSGKVQKESILSDLNHGINTRATELLFLKWFIDHLADKGRAGVIVPEGIIFQSQKAYKSLRKMLLENYLWAVVSLPSGVFNPYAGVKTSILLMDKSLAKRIDKILFIKIENDGFDLGAQRRPIDKNDLPAALKFLNIYKSKAETYKSTPVSPQACPGGPFAHIVPKSEIAKSGDYNLSGDRYRVATDYTNAKWPMVKIKEIASLHKIRSNENEWPYIEIGDVDIISKKYSYKDKKSVKGSIYAKKGNIVVSKVRPTRGAISIIQENSIIVSGGFSVLDLNKDRINPNYLFFLISSNEDFLEYLGSKSKGATYPTCSDEDVLSFEIPLPPLEIQEQIVAELDGYQNIISGARQVVENWKPKIVIDPKWGKVKFGDVCEIKSGGTPSRANKEYWNGNIPWYSSGELNDLYTSEPNEYITIKGIENSNAVVFPKGSLLIGMYDTAAFKMSILERDASFNQAICAVKPNNKVNLYFLYLFFLENRNKYLNQRIGVRQRNLSKGYITNIEIDLPPLEIQKQIVAQIEAEQQIINANKKLIETYEQKIKDKIAEVWGCGTSQDAVKATTPYKDDAAVICLLLQEMEKLQRPTTEFFIQKHIFVTKHYLHLPVNSIFVRKVAGPWSQELKEKAIFFAIKKKWLRWEKGRLVAGSAFEKALNHAATVLGEAAADITRLVQDLKAFGNNGLERWTTVLKVVEDLKDTQQPITRSNIQREINSWPGKSLKEIFAEESVDHTIKMMLKHNWLPTSAGQ